MTKREICSDDDCKEEKMLLLGGQGIKGPDGLFWIQRSKRGLLVPRMICPMFFVILLRTKQLMTEASIASSSALSSD